MSPEYPEREDMGAPPAPEAPAEPPAQSAPPFGSTEAPAASGAPKSHRKSPATAGLLSLVPGLGQVYVGYYQRGFIHLLVVACAITLVASGVESQSGPGLAPLLGMFIPFYWLYNIIDAVRLAHGYNDLMAGARREDLLRGMSLPSRGGSVAGGIVLVGVGFVVLLHTVFGVPLDWLEKWWPIAPILFGAYLIIKGVQDRNKNGE